MDGSSPGEQQVQNNALLRPGLEPETSQPQRSSLPLDHNGLVVSRIGVGVDGGVGGVALIYLCEFFTLEKKT